MRYGRRLTAEIGIGILVILLFVLCGTGESLPKGVLPAPPAGPITVKIATDNSTYAPGAGIRITVEVDKECYLYLYDIDPAGTVTLLFPNRFQPDPRVGPGKLSLPGKGYRFVVSGPEGEETLVALASLAPIPALAPDEKHPFREYEIKPEEFVQQLESGLESGAYSVAWTRIQVYQPKGVVRIDSVPEGAKIYVDGNYVGNTPKTLILPAGTRTITLRKDGFAPYSQRLQLADRTAAEISARLEEVEITPPEEGGALPSGFVVIDLGANSVGGELGIGRTLGVTASARFLHDPDLVGPELQIGIRFHLPTASSLRLVLGIGIGLQERYVVTPPGTPIPEKIDIQPETETAVVPSASLGFALNLSPAILFGGYDLRRGPTIGVGLAF